MAIVTQSCDQHLRMGLHGCGPDKHLQCKPQRKIQRREQRHPSQRPLQLDRLLRARKGIPRNSDWISQFPNTTFPPHYLSPLHVVFLYLTANFNLAIPFSPPWYCSVEVPFASLFHFFKNISSLILHKLTQFECSLWLTLPQVRLLNFTWSPVIATPFQESLPPNSLLAPLCIYYFIYESTCYLFHFLSKNSIIVTIQTLPFVLLFLFLSASSNTN